MLDLILNKIMQGYMIMNNIIVIKKNKIIHRKSRNKKKNKQIFYIYLLKIKLIKKQKILNKIKKINNKNNNCKFSQKQLTSLRIHKKIKNSNSFNQK